MRFRELFPLRWMFSGAFHSKMIGQKILLYNIDFPRIVSFSPIDRECFYRCRMCPFSLERVRKKHHGTEMDFDTLRRFVEQVPNDPFFAFDISAMGETLALDALSGFIRFMKIRRCQVPITVSTNGFLLDSYVMKKLIRAGLDRLQVSLFANNAQDHEWITGIAGHYERICDNVIGAAETKRVLGGSWPKIQVFILGIEEFRDDFSLFVGKWGGVVDRAFIRPVYNACLTDLGMTPIHSIPNERYPCIMPWYCASISADGNVWPCTFYAFHRECRLGNVNDQSLSEIWNGGEMETFRLAHLQGRWNDFSLCEYCDLWSAYTNIWDEGEDGFSFQFRPADLMGRVPAYRGG